MSCTPQGILVNQVFQDVLGNTYTFSMQDVAHCLGYKLVKLCFFLDCRIITEVVIYVYPLRAKPLLIHSILKSSRHCTISYLCHTTPHYTTPERMDCHCCSGCPVPLVPFGITTHSSISFALTLIIQTV